MQLNKIFFLLTYFYAIMDKQKQKEQEDKLKEIAKNAPKNIQKVIQEKIKGVSKPFNK